MARTAREIAAYLDGYEHGCRVLLGKLHIHRGLVPVKATEELIAQIELLARSADGVEHWAQTPGFRISQWLKGRRDLTWQYDRMPYAYFIFVTLDLAGGGTADVPWFGYGFATREQAQAAIDRGVELGHVERAQLSIRDMPIVPEEVG